RGRRQRWRLADALTLAARRTRLLGVDGGEQLLHGTRRRRTERLVEVDGLRKLFAHEIIAPREFAVARERLLDAIGVPVAERPCRVPRQQSFDLVALWLFVDRVHGQPLSVPAASNTRKWHCVSFPRPNASHLTSSRFARYAHIVAFCEVSSTSLSSVACLTHTAA